MKIISILSAALLLQGACYGGETAYQAMRVLSQERTQALLNRVIEVQGKDGASQPVIWKIVLDDPAARGGVREFEVEHGHIISERTPVHSYSGVAENAVMDFKKLNLDSAGAFTIATKEASEAHVGFDSLDYVLRCGDGDAAPVWILKLLDAGKHEVGTILISADTGAVVRKEGFGPGGNVAAQNPVGSDNIDKSGSNQDLGAKVKQSFIHAGASVEEFFTGHRTLEQNNNN